MRTFKMILMFWHVLNIWESWMVLFCSETPNLLVLVFSLFDIKSTVFGIFIIWHLIYRFWYFQLFAPLCRYFLASLPSAPPPPLPSPFPQKSVAPPQFCRISHTSKASKFYKTQNPWFSLEKLPQKIHLPNGNMWLSMH